MNIPRARLIDDRIHVGRLAINFQRTLRIPDDGRCYPLPPGLGSFPVRRVSDFARRVPSAWRERAGYFIPMYQREALWISFDGPYWRPNAVKVGVGGVNAISGKPWDDRLRSRPQDYLVVPDQPWLDGINAGRSVVRQFVAMPLGLGFTVEGQVTGAEEEGGMQLTVVQPTPGRFPDQPPRSVSHRYGSMMICESAPASQEMGLAAGGRMQQKIYPDQYGKDTWDPKASTTFHVHIVNTDMYHDITGEAPPPTPISAQTYTDYGLPWFVLYDEQRGDVAAPDVLAGLSSIATMEKMTEDGFVVSPSQIAGLPN